MLKKNIKIDRESMELISLFINISGASYVNKQFHYEK